MPIATPPAAFSSIADHRPEQLSARMASARRIRERLRRESGHQPLRGRHLALLSPSEARHAPTPVQEAAVELGACVAQVRHWREDGVCEADVVLLGRILGRLYDAIDCPALPPDALDHLRQSAGVPVYDGLDGQSHPLRALADLMTLVDHPLMALGGARTVVVRTRGASINDARTRAFCEGAQALGLVVKQDGWSSPDFVLDRRSETDWRLISIDSRHDDSLSESRRAAHHRALIQSLLIQTIDQV